MKRLLCLCLVLLVCLPSVSLAEEATFTINLDTATVEELEAARAAIDARLADLRAASAEAPADAVHFEGVGLFMIPMDSFPFFPCRMVFSVDAAGKARLDITGGKNDWSEEFTATAGDLSRVYSYDANNYGASGLSLLVTTDAGWTLDIYPLTDAGAPAFTGAGNAVGDLFTLAGPMAVTVTYDASASGSDYLTITLVTPSEHGYLREKVFSSSLRGDEAKGSADVFIKPNKDRPCFYIVECKPGTTWAVTPKE